MPFSIWSYHFILSVTSKIYPHVFLSFLQLLKFCLSLNHSEPEKWKEYELLLFTETNMKTGVDKIQITYVTLFYIYSIL